MLFATGSPKFNTTIDEDEDDDVGYLCGERNSTPSENGLDETEDEAPAAVKEQEGQREPAGGSVKLEAAIQSIKDTLKEYKVEERLGKHHNSRPAPLLCSTAERCNIALQHIVDGLQCLQYFDNYEEQKQREKEKEAERQKIVHEETHPNMAKSDNAIPLPYQPLRPEPCPVDPAKIIPMGWKEGCADAQEEKDSERNGKAGKKRSKRKDADKQLLWFPLYCCTTPAQCYSRQIAP